jgi:hypothetical protein
MPASKDVGTNIKNLKAANKGRSKPRSQKQVLAIALEESRRLGGNAPKKKKR